MSAWENNEEIEIFREYLRIPSVHPDIDYEPCVEFLRKHAAELGMSFKVECPVTPKKPVCILTWVGTDPSLPSIVLNSHMDVVPVYEEFWTHKPFAAEIDEDGKIFARGAQDMKCVGMQYLAALRHFKRNNMRFKRTIHCTFVPEEEIGGVDGMRDFVHTKAFKDLNIGFSLDEGGPSHVNEFAAFYAERSIWHVEFVISGVAGHGSTLPEGTAGEKLKNFVNKIMDFRAAEVKRMEDENLFLGDVTSVNITRIHGGVLSNVIPSEYRMTVDFRLSLQIDHVEFENRLKTWCEESGGGIEMVYEQKQPKIAPTKIDSSNPYYVAFNDAVNELDLKVNYLVFPGGTDSRYMRGVGIPAIGFSPMNNTPWLLHDHDEYIKADVYLRGIEIYKKIISNIANVN